ncbi:DUF1778 domain-containing protein [Spirulina sp. 06S082]|uniref:type II toxin-antitoxin system TacA family antitoxin n=1 Tax=Spirulina sp. 06S082 TaxID=3110248 RepID=UPI002B21A0F8|nr:DUF1778 domain-containing protein [Spirulina sp. 06S082]MEA5468242.1 DUF1778 domain-containing protein [Spirulina sp. 06S082]
MPTIARNIKTAKATRSETISLRAKPNQIALIDRAAEIQGKTRTQFLLDSACQEANDVILDQTLFALDEEKFQEFMEAIDAPPMNNEKLRALLNSKSPWE